MNPTLGKVIFLKAPVDSLVMSDVSAAEKLFKLIPDVIRNSLFPYPPNPEGFNPIAQKSGPIANMLFPVPRFLAVPIGSEYEKRKASVAVWLNETIGQIIKPNMM